MAKIGVSTEILDGNLRQRVTLPEDIVVCVSRAVSGPSNDIYIVSDTEAAKRMFGAGSPIIQLMNGALAGGAPSVALYRIGGGEAKVEDLFGDYTALRTTDASVRADSDLKVYSGVLESNPNYSIFIVYKGDRIVYSNLPGREINSGIVSLDGFDANTFPFAIGTPTNPVAFKDIPASLMTKGVESYAYDAGNSNSEFNLKVSGATIVQVLRHNLENDTTKTLKATTDYQIVDEDTIQLVIPLTISESLQIVYSFKDTSPSANETIKYVAGKDSLGAGYNKLYELYDSAFMELEMYDVFGAVIDDLHNTPNIVDPSIDKTKDHLTYVIRSEGEEGYEYEWSPFKFVFRAASGIDQTTTDPSKAALDATGSPIVLKQYNEVDFVHRLGVWCYSQSDIGHYVNGVCGPLPPKSSYSLAVNRWIGTSPKKDIYGNIIENGSGLLGNRFIAGTVTRSRGFYMTDTGYPDGDIKRDSTQVNIDLGKYLSIPVIPVMIPTIRGSQVRSSAAMYSGMLPNVNPGDSTTNMPINQGIVPLFKLKSDKIQKLSNAGYVVLEEKESSINVYSGNLPTVNSDYKYVSTGIAVSRVIKRVRKAADPYIGKGSSVDLFTTLFNAIDASLKESVSLGYVNGFSFNVLQTDMNELLVPIDLAPKHEIRAIRTTIALVTQDSYSSETQSGGNQ